MKLTMRWAVVAAIAAGVMSGQARADQTITFSNYTGPSGGAFTSYSEAGFTVTATSGQWQYSQSAGQPSPSVYSQDALGSLEVIQAIPGEFTFDSIDPLEVSFSSQASEDYSLRGYLGATSVFDVTGSTVGTSVIGDFTTVQNPDPGALIDRLEISFARGANGAGLILDNIVLNPSLATPEPSTLALVGAGIPALLVVGYRRRRRLA